MPVSVSCTDLAGNWQVSATVTKRVEMRRVSADENNDFTRVCLYWDWQLGSIACTLRSLFTGSLEAILAGCRRRRHCPLRMANWP